MTARVRISESSVSGNICGWAISRAEATPTNCQIETTGGGHLVQISRRQDPLGTTLTGRSRLPISVGPHARSAEHA